MAPPTNPGSDPTKLQVVPASWRTPPGQSQTTGPLEEWMTVLKLIPPKPAGQSSVFADLYFVLDVSGSMAGDKLTKLKSTMKKIIDDWTRWNDEICIISFSTEAQVVFSRSAMGRSKNDPTIKQKKDRAKQVVDSLVAGGWTQMQKGLEVALREVTTKSDTIKRPAAIILMSDGAENYGSNAAQAAIQRIPIDTIGFGTEHEHNVLRNVASMSKGTFTNSSDFTTLGSAMSPLLDHWKHISIMDLELTFKPTDPRTRLQVIYGSYYPHKTTGAPGAAVTVNVPNLSEHNNWVTVYSYLPPAQYDGEQTVMTVTWSYTRLSGGYHEPPQTIPINVFRTGTGGGSAPARRTRALADTMMIPPKQVRTEQIRLSQVEMIKKVRDLADSGMYQEAQGELSAGMDVLDEALELDDSHVSKRAIGHFYAEVEHLFTVTESEATYKKQGGQAFVAACISSHDLQRCVARGDENCRVRLFATDRMSQYLDEAIYFDRMTSGTA